MSMYTLPISKFGTKKDCWMATVVGKGGFSVPVMMEYLGKISKASYSHWCPPAVRNKSPNMFVCNTLYFRPQHYRSIALFGSCVDGRHESRVQGKCIAIPNI